MKFVFCDQLEQFRMTLSLEIITGFTTGLVVSMTGHFMHDANDNNAQKSIRRRVVIHQRLFLLEYRPSIQHIIFFHKIARHTMVPAQQILAIARQVHMNTNPLKLFTERSTSFQRKRISNSKPRVRLSVSL